MGKLIVDIDGLESLSDAERTRLERQVNDLVSDALQRHRRHEVGEPTIGLMSLAGCMKSDRPRLTDDQERAVIQRHILAENPRPER